VPEMQMAVQVCYSITDVETRKREINALLQLIKRIDIKRMFIITKDEENTISENGVNIEVIPIWKWLINN
jgi:predicted AAA+ superfamily ATPase